MHCSKKSHLAGVCVCVYPRHFHCDHAVCYFMYNVLIFDNFGTIPSINKYIFAYFIYVYVVYLDKILRLSHILFRACMH